MANKSNVPAVVPALGGEASLNRYLAEIRKFPLLTPEQEYMLAKRFQEHGDNEAAAQLVTSHLRLVAKIAMGYRGYGLPVSELISEGNIGLMQGVKKFEPDRGFRLATYAMWWIRASIQEFILRSWSLVKMGTTAAQKKLFFNLRRMKAKLDAFEDGDLTPEHLAKIASGAAKPDGLLSVPIESELEFLHALPIERLWGVDWWRDAEAELGEAAGRFDGDLLGAAGRRREFRQDDDVHGRPSRAPPLLRERGVPCLKGRSTAFR